MIIEKKMNLTCAKHSQEKRVTSHGIIALCSLFPKPVATGKRNVINNHHKSEILDYLLACHAR